MTTIRTPAEIAEANCSKLEEVARRQRIEDETADDALLPEFLERVAADIEAYYQGGSILVPLPGVEWKSKPGCGPLVGDTTVRQADRFAEKVHEAFAASGWHIRAYYEGWTSYSYNSNFWEKRGRQAVIVRSREDGEKEDREKAELQSRFDRTTAEMRNAMNMETFPKVEIPVEAKPKPDTSPDDWPELPEDSMGIGWMERIRRAMR